MRGGGRGARRIRGIWDEHSSAACNFVSSHCIYWQGPAGSKRAFLIGRKKDVDLAKNLNKKQLMVGFKMNIT